MNKAENAKEQLAEREIFIDNLLVRIHFIIVMIRWTVLAPWEFQFPFPGSLISTFNQAKECHPDVNKAENAKEQFAEVNNAYEILGDQDKRDMYVFIYIYIYIYVYICCFIYLFIIYIYMYICICMYVCMYICTYVFMYVCIYREGGGRRERAEQRLRAPRRPGEARDVPPPTRANMANPKPSTLNPNPKP